MKISLFLVTCALHISFHDLWFEPAKYITMHVVPRKYKFISSIFTSNSEANTSELLVNIEEINFLVAYNKNK